MLKIFKRKEDKLGLLSRLKQGFSKSSSNFSKSIAGIFGGGKIDDKLYEELEMILLSSDIGVRTTQSLLSGIQQEVSYKGLKDSSELYQTLRSQIFKIVKRLEEPLVIDRDPFVILMVGVNGAGKTTSIGKLAHLFKSEGKSVMLVAGDTFRAGAAEQLSKWGERNGVDVVSRSNDVSSLCFDAVRSSVPKKINVVIVDTAGRLPTQLNLMEEIKKVKRVINKAMPDAPHEVMLVLDSNIGQNSLSQLQAFDSALDVSGLILTKLDGSTKGGIVVSIANEIPRPIRYIGLGEGTQDIETFNAKNYVDALFD